MTVSTFLIKHSCLMRAPRNMKMGTPTPSLPLSGAGVRVEGGSIWVLKSLREKNSWSKYSIFFWRNKGFHPFTSLLLSCILSLCFLSNKIWFGRHSIRFFAVRYGRTRDKIESVYKRSLSLMPDLIRHPDVVPTKVGNHLEDWVPVFTGNPGFRLSPEWCFSLRMTFMDRL